MGGIKFFPEEFLTRIMENFDKIQLFRSRLFFLGQALDTLLGVPQALMYEGEYQG